MGDGAKEGSTITSIEEQGGIIVVVTIQVATTMAIDGNTDFLDMTLTCPILMIVNIFYTQSTP